MKKIKLFLAACAAMVGLSVQAQTAADFANGKYVFQNVGAGRYMGPGNSWGTTASFIEFSHFNTINKISDGVYKIESQVSNGGTNYYLGVDGNLFLDNGGSNIKIFDNGDGTYAMQVDGQSTYIGYDGTSTVIAQNLADVSADNAKWKIMAYDDVYAGASETNPVDVTYMILCSNFDRNHRSASAWTMEASNKNLSGGTNENKCAESWQSSFTLSQTVTVPNGYYKLQAQACLQEYTVTGTDFPVVYATSGANTVSVPFQTMTNTSGGMNQKSTDFTNGEYFTGYTPVITVTNGSLTVGVKGTRTNTWCIWDNFQLVYMGPIDLSTYATELANAVAAAQAYESQLPAAVYSLIADAITENNKTYSTEAEYTAAITAINNAVSSNATAAIIADYARYNTVKAAAVAIASSMDVTGADAEVGAATTTAAIDAAIATLRAAFLTELPNVTVPTDGLDVTAVMVDNASVAQNTNYWTSYKYPSSPDGGSFGKCSYDECEFYQQNFKFYQTLALTPGTWEFGVTGFHRAGNHSTYFYAGDDKILIPGVASSVVNTMAQAKDYFDAGNGKVALKFLIESAGDVEIGIDNQDTETDKWTIFRDFTLKYYGAPDYSVYDARLAELATEAAAVEGTVPAAVYATLNGVVTENNTTHANKAEYMTAISNIEAAIATAKAFVAPYNEYKAVKAKVEAMKSVEGYSETTSGATTTLTSAVADADEAVNAATTAEAIAEQVTALKAAGKTFIGGVRSDGAHPFDITFLITNPSFDNNDATGWTATPAPGFQSYTNCEYYQTEFDINQTLTGMPKGNYELKVQAFQRPGWWDAVYSAYQTGTNNVSSVIYINDGQTTIKNLVSEGATDADHQWNNGNDSNNGTVYYANSMNGAAQAFKAGNYWNSVLTAVEGVLKFGFKSTKTHVDGDWTIFDNFQLYYYGNSINVTMDEAQAFSALADIEGANVTMVRNGKASYNTVALPFDLTEAQVKDVFGDGVEVYSFSDEGDANNTTVNFNKTATAAIQANVPVLVKATQTSTQIDVDNVTVKTGEAKVEGNNFDFVGNYGGPVTIAEGDYFISGDKLYKSTGATTIKGFRAYLKAKTTGSNVKMYIDGLETSISEINGEGIENGVIYNLAGQRVNKAQKGIYIQNGKKVLVK